MKCRTLIIATLIGAPLFMNAADLIVKKSHHNVDETVMKMQKIIQSKAKKGLAVFTVIDHKAAAQKAGMTMRDEKVIIFGNPKLGTKLMQKDPRTGLDLPLRVLVYQDKDGTTKIAYHNPQEWQKGYSLEGCKLIGKMTGVLDKITSKAAE